MNTAQIHSHADKSADRVFLKKRDERLFQVLFVLSFPAFLAVVFTTRLLPHVGEGSDTKKQVSMLSEASQSARSTIAQALTD